MDPELQTRLVEAIEDISNRPISASTLVVEDGRSRSVNIVEGLLAIANAIERLAEQVGSLSDSVANLSTWGAADG